MFRPLWGGGQTSWLKGSPIALTSAESKTRDKTRLGFRFYSALGCHFWRTLSVT